MDQLRLFNPVTRESRRRPSPRERRILLVDNEEFVTEIVCRWLRSAGYACDAVSSGEEALRVLDGDGYALVISDITMPGMSGLELLERLQHRLPHLAVIVATAISDRMIAVRALELGAYGYLIKPLDENEVVISVANALERRRLELLGERYQKHLMQEVRARTSELRRTREEVSLLLVTASEFRDLETGAHVRRMGLYAEALAKALGWGTRAADNMRLAAPMHDVGKIGVPDNILLKPGRLTDAEFEVIKRHTKIGARILSGADLPILHLARQIAHFHHERWDGSGYPHGLLGETIPEPARLVAIIDVYDALVHDRVYRDALPEEEALRIIESGSGTHFDPKMLDAFFELLPTVREIRQQLAAAGGTSGYDGVELARELEELPRQHQFG